MEPLAPSSQQFKRMEYFLQLTLGAPAVHVERATPLIPGDAMSAWDDKWQGMAMLDGWVSPKDIPQELVSLASNPSSTQETGEILGHEGMVIKTGAVWLLEGKEATRRTHEVVLVRAVIGRAYIVEEASFKRAVEKKTASLVRVPDGYNSLYLHGPEMPDYSDGVGGIGLGDRAAVLKALNASRRFQHKFVVQNATQVIPLVHVAFSIDEGETSKRKKPPTCEVCIRNFAVVYCRADDANLCAKCDKEVHSANALVMRHVRTPLNQPRVFGTCKDHPGQKLEFVCSVCDIPVCVHCKMVGSHSKGEFAEHKLVSLESKYSKAVAESRETSPDILSYRKDIDDRLSRVSDVIKRVEQNCAAVEEQLYKAVSEAVDSLRSMTQRKLAALRGDELALRREQTRIEWVEGYLEYQRAVLGPIPFLHAWDNHQNVRQALRQDCVAATMDSVAPDMHVTGQLTLESEAAQEKHVVGPGTEPVHMSQGATLTVPARTADHIQSQVTLMMKKSKPELAAVLRAVRGEYMQSDEYDSEESEEEEEEEEDE